MPTAAAKRRAGHGAAALPTREVILDTAERLFAARGVEGVAVRDLAREMGITASSLYNHFSGKQALYDAVLERGLGPIVETVAVAWQGGLGPERVHAPLDRLPAHLALHPDLAPPLRAAPAARSTEAPWLTRSTAASPTRASPSSAPASGRASRDAARGAPR